MKFVKALVVGCCLAAVGCAQNGNKNAWNYDGSQAVVLATTEQYLPIRDRDEFGTVIPYVGQPNPYSELKGRIDKEAVERYIDARRAFGAKKYDFADQVLSELVVAEPKLSGPWVMRGEIALAQNDADKAIEHFAQAITVNKVNFNAYLRLAKAQRQQGYFSHAQNTYAKALALWPDCPEAHLNLGVLYDLYLNKPEMAQAHMEAYLLLSDSPQGAVTSWVNELRERTGIATLLKINEPEGGVVAPPSEAVSQDEAEKAAAEFLANQELASQQAGN